MLANAGGVPTTNASPGPPTSGAHVAGQQCIDSLGGLWECVTAGTPGGWGQSQPCQGSSLPS